MARTFGGGASDRLKVANYAAINSLTELTIMAWLYRTGGGGNNLGRVIDKRNTAAVGSAAWYLAYDDSVTEYFFDTYRWSTTGGAWRTTGDAAIINTLHHLALTYSFSSTSNDAQFYINGVATGMEELSAPSGTPQSESVDLVIGNRDNNDRNWAGGAGEISLHDRILSVGEIYAASRRYAANHFPRGLVGYWNVTGRLSPEPNLVAGSTAVVTGTTGIPDEHPPMILRRPRSFIAVPSVGGGSFVGAGLTRSRLLERPRFA